MTTARQYWGALRTTRNQIAQAMGTWIPSLPVEARAVSNADMALVGIVMKALVDNNVLTDAQLQAAQAAALAEVWDPEAPQQPGPGI